MNSIVATVWLIAVWSVTYDLIEAWVREGMPKLEAQIREALSD